MVNMSLTNRVEALKTEFARLKHCGSVSEPSYSPEPSSLLHTGRDWEPNQSTISIYLVAKPVYPSQIGICLHFPRWTDSKFEM